MENLVNIIGAIIILVIIIVGFYVYLKKRKNTNDDVAEEFLDGLQNSLYTTARNIVNLYDFHSGKPLEEMESEILTTIYDDTWNYVNSYMKDNGNLVTDLILNIITKDVVVDYVDKLISKKGLVSRIQENYAAANIEDNSEKIIEEDKKLEEEFSDQSEYIENSNDDDLPEAEPVVIPDDVELNPQKDEVEYDEENDDSIEILEKKIILKHDKNGNELYYLIDEDGKKSRVSKQYVIESGITPVEE